MEIVKGSLGPEAGYEVKFEGGKFVVGINYAGAELGGGLNIALDIDMVINAIEKAIPGQIDDAVLNLVKAALKAL